MRAADRGWLALAIGVCVYEVVACRRGWELLSEAADRHRARHPVIIHGAILYLAGHLARVWPSRADPLARLARWLR